MAELKRYDEGLLALPPADLLKEVLRSGEKVSREEWIPLDLIDMADVIADDNHARLLGKLMMGPWGITQPVMVRARFVNETPNAVVYDPLDGYHRIRGLELVSPEGRATKIKSVVLYGCTNEEMYDQRIAAANSVASVKFARVCTWMNRAWEATPWHGIMTVAQAFGLATFKLSGKQLVGDDETAVSIKGWVTDKSCQWASTVSTIYTHLCTFEASDPDLVIRVRTGSFTKGELALTPGQLEIITSMFPHKEYPGVQIKIARFATSHSLSTADLGELVREIKGKGHGGVTARLLDTVFTSNRWSERQVDVSHKNKQKFTRQKATKALRQAVVQVSHIPNLHTEVRSQILEQIGDAISTLDSSTDSLIGKKHDADVETSIQFIHKWDNRQIADSFYQNAALRSELADDLKKLGLSATFLMAQYFADRCFSRVVNERDLACHIIRQVPLHQFNQECVTSITTVFIERMKQMESLEYTRQDVSAIVESTLELLSSLTGLDAMLPKTTWEKLLLQLAKTTLYTDSMCRQAVLDWIQTVKPGIITNYLPNGNAG